MLTLFSIPESLYSAKLRIVLRAKGVVFEQAPPPGGYGSEAYREVVPAGTVPAIVHDGFVLADSEAIAEYIEDYWPEPPLLPTGAQARARARERSRFHDTRLEPEIRALFGHVSPAGRDDGFVAAKANLISQRLSQLAVMVAGWDGVLTLGDCGFPASFVWLDQFFPAIGAEIEWPEPVLAYRKRLLEIAVVTEEIEAYVQPATAWTDGKLARQDPNLTQS